MKAKHLRKWLKALRSGEYAKGTSQLVTAAGDPDDEGKTREYDRFCCLGVLCDVLGYEMSIDYANKGDYDGWGGSLPTDIAKEVGLSDEIQEILAGLNDSGAAIAFTNKKTGKVRACRTWDAKPENYTEKQFRATTFRGIAQAIERLLK